MAHDCPVCCLNCHCNGDIDDMNFGISDEYCSHCEEIEDEENCQSEEDYYEEERESRIDEKLSECRCGAFQLNTTGNLIQVADCIC